MLEINQSLEKVDESLQVSVFYVISAKVILIVFHEFEIVNGPHLLQKGVIHKAFNAKGYLDVVLIGLNKFESPVVMRSKHL